MTKEEFLEKCTDYFYDYDYIVGDIAYGKLRLKGFYDEKSKKVKKINNYKNIDEYLKKYKLYTYENKICLYRKTKIKNNV